MVFIPRAQPQAQSLFQFPIVFGINSNTYKTRKLFGQHFDGEVSRNLKHVFLRPFEHGFKKNWDVYVPKLK